MPTYVYQASGAASCSDCVDPFEVIQKVHHERLSRCPACGAPVRQVITPPQLLRSDSSLTPDNLESHGFTQYRRVGKGQYEKTAGKGPPRISDSDD